MKQISLNASSAFRWTECTASPQYLADNAHLIPPQDSEFSIEGTIAHKVVEALFSGEKLPKGHNAEMVRHGKSFVDFCRLASSKDLIWWSELKVDLFYMPGRSGYVDWCATNVHGIYVADYKYGVGVAVKAEGNLQMAIYARSMVAQLEVVPEPSTAIRMTIFQPRVREGEKVSTWTITWAELVQFTNDRVLGPAEDIKAKALVLQFAPGTKTCQFCPAESFCAARAAWLLDDTPLKPLLKGEKVVLPDWQTLSPKVIGNLIGKADDIKKWFTNGAKYALSMAMNGKPVPGTKVVLSQGPHRTWSDREKAKALLLANCDRADVIKEELVTPKQAEEFEFDFEKKDWAKLTSLAFKPPGSPILVGEDDPRPAWSQNGSDFFQDETNSDDWL